MGKLTWLKRKATGSVLFIIEVVLGNTIFWLTLYFIFHFDDWYIKVLSVAALWGGVYLFAKVADKFYSE
jgi:hypothetical protein